MNTITIIAALLGVIIVAGVILAIEVDVRLERKLRKDKES